MWFDPQVALRKIEGRAPANAATSATQKLHKNWLRVADVASVATLHPRDEKTEKAVLQQCSPNLNFDFNGPRANADLGDATLQKSGNVVLLEAERKNRRAK
mgnify:FL=1